MINSINPHIQETTKVEHINMLDLNKKRKAYIPKLEIAKLEITNEIL